MQSFVSKMSLIFLMTLYLGSILVNGVSTGDIEGKAGLEQGDPVSPSIFLLTMELLGELLL